MNMSGVEQRPWSNYFISVDFILRTFLCLIAISLLILQHVFTFCQPRYRPSGVFFYEFFAPSFGTESFSAMGLYVTCWVIIVLYIHTILLVFMDNFQMYHHAVTYVIVDMITSIFYLTWMIMNILQLSDCSERQLASDRNQTHVRFEKPFCASIPCSAYLGPSIGCLVSMFIATGLAASAFPKINYRKIPRYIRDYGFSNQLIDRKPNSNHSQQSITSLHNDKKSNNANIPMYPVPSVRIFSNQQSIKTRPTNSASERSSIRR